MQKAELTTSKPAVRPKVASSIVDPRTPPSERVGGSVAIREAAEAGLRQAEAERRDEQLKAEAEVMLAHARAGRPLNMTTVDPELTAIASEDTTDPVVRARLELEEVLQGKARRSSIRDPEQVQRDKMRFLQALEISGSVKRACDVIRRSRTCVMGWRERDPVFAEAWRDVWESKVDELEGSMLHRATHGFEKPVWYLGQQVGTETVHSPQLSIFMLSKLRPETYGPQLEASTVTPQQQAELARSFMRAMQEMHTLAQESAESPRVQEARGTSP